MILILTDAVAKGAAERLEAAFRKRGEKTRRVDVSELSVKACTGCDGCFEGTYGRCVHRDDMDWVMPLFFAAERTVWMTGLTWGVVSYPIKKVLDRTAVIGDRFYYIQNGELVKGSQTDNRKWCIFGVKEQASPEEAEALMAYVKENAILLNVPFAAGVLPPMPEEKAVQKIAGEVLA